jgi:uncharacterized protein
MIDRLITPVVQKALIDSKQIVILYGARQTGKTTIASEIIRQFKGKVLQVNGDELKYADILSSRNFDQINLLIDGYDLLFIDEAQRIPDIGLNLKIIHDRMPQLKILVTGSSSFDLAQKLAEPLTGRTLTYKLYPIALAELRAGMSIFELKQSLQTLMIYGMYPALHSITNASDKEKQLIELSTSYLYKDIFELSSIRNASKIRDLLRMLAFQVGAEVSIPELSQNLSMSQETVNHYIDLLEKAFIIYRLGAFSGNLRKEISKKCKVYFWDTGIRNSLINNFAGFTYRNDTGALWENFVVSERLKYLSYNNINATSYFWRTYTGAEIDYMEEYNGKYKALEIKMKNKGIKPPKTWTDLYGTDFNLIHPENFHEFLI